MDLINLSDLITYATGGAVMCLYVFFKAFQQRNVAFDHYTWVMPISWCMALTEVFVISLVVKTGFNILLAFSIGTGAGIGALVAMYIHKKYVTKHPKPVLMGKVRGMSVVTPKVDDDV